MVKKRRRTKAQISYNMSRIRSKNTSIEKMFAFALRKACIKFKRNDRKIFGNPDFIIANKKIAVFCDSAFWHGYRHMRTKLHNFKKRKKFWLEKISANIKRDKYVNKILKKEGWKVIRLWDFQIKKDIKKCLEKILRETKKR